MSAYDRYRAAGGRLAADGITVVLDTRSTSKEDAWTAAVAAHGSRVASAWLYDGRWREDGLLWCGSSYPVTRIRFSYDARNLTIGDAIVDAFRSEGFEVEWNREPTRAVHVLLS